MRLPPFSSLVALEAAARHRSYSRAAQGLFAMTHGAVSQQVRKLEEELGGQLFARRGNQMEPTATGRGAGRPGRRGHGRAAPGRRHRPSRRQRPDRPVRRPSLRHQLAVAPAGAAVGRDGRAGPRPSGSRTASPTWPPTASTSPCATASAPGRAWSRSG
ncbi:LysR family transcriptional regulator [Caulobacter segnis]